MQQITYLREKIEKGKYLSVNKIRMNNPKKLCEKKVREQILN